MQKMTATIPTEALSSEVAVSDTRGLEVWSVYATLAMLTVPRSLRPKQNMEKDKQLAIKEKQHVAKEKQKNPVLVRKSLQMCIPRHRNRRNIRSQRK